VLPHIFNAFEQGSPEVARKFGGLGLGMAIAKALVDMHGGTITARSDGQGKGATFTVQLWTCSCKQATGLQTKKPPKSERRKGGRILLVEDHPDTGILLHRLLTSFGYDVQLVTNMASALHAAESDRFDVVVSDIGLPDGTGLDLMKQLNAKRPIKGIAVSGWGMSDDIRRSIEAGFIAHLTKPVDVDSLEKVLREAIAK
jgi:CheY-like chemotaxis protein